PAAAPTWWGLPTPPTFRLPALPTRRTSPPPDSETASWRRSHRPWRASPSRPTRSPAAMPASAPSSSTAPLLPAALPNPPLATAPTSVTSPEGGPYPAFSVPTSAVSFTSPVTIPAAPAGDNQSADLTVLPASLAKVSVLPTSVTGGSNSIGIAYLTGTA